MSVCGAILSIADDYGDNSGTITCKLEEGHEGLHQEKFARGDCGTVVITWEKDGRSKCSWCGALAKDYATCHHIDPETDSCLDCCLPVCCDCQEKATVDDVPCEYSGQPKAWWTGVYCPSHIEDARKSAAERPKPKE